jgi:hypothetical protein
MKYDYLYLDNTKIVEDQEHYEVIRVKILDNDRWTAELKARRFAKNNKLGKLAGGCFTDKPYNFKSNYKIYICPDDYKPVKESKHDKFIADLIEYDNNLEFVIL